MWKSCVNSPVIQCCDVKKCALLLLSFPYANIYVCLWIQQKVGVMSTFQFNFNSKYFYCCTNTYMYRRYPASIATLAQRLPLRWTNVGSPTLGQRGFVNWPNVGPTVARQRWPNVVPTSAQRWHTNVGPTLAQRCANGCMPTLYQHWPNGGCVTGFLWGEPIGHRSVTGWTNSRVE